MTDFKAIRERLEKAKNPMDMPLYTALCTQIVMNDVPDLLAEVERLKPLAELGELAVKVNTHGDFCECKYGSEECKLYDCSDSLQVFCIKRAEIEGSGET